MIDRTNYLTVVLDGAYRDDDIERVTNAIHMLKGVLTVQINVTDPSEYMAINRAKNDLRKKIYEVLD